MRNGTSSAEIHRKLITAWGEDNVCGLRHIQRIAKEINDGKRQSFDRKDGSGMTRTSRTAENIEAVKRIVDASATVSINYLSNMTGLHESTVQRILTLDLEKRSVYARWVPYNLTEVHKQQRVAGARIIRETITGNVIVIDEKWLYAEPHPSQNNVRAWVDPGGDRPTLARCGMSARKFHIIVGINFRGDHYFEVLQAGESINSERYIAFLQQILAVRRQGTVTIMHDNARPHVARATNDFLQENNVERVVQPPYSPDMNLCDRYIFRNMEAHRAENVFNDRNSVLEFLGNYLEQFSRYKLGRELTRLREDLQKIIDLQGDYLK